MIRALSIVGKAAKKISLEFKEKNFDIPWRDMAGTRDVFIHDYDSIDLDMVWNIARYDLPPIIEVIKKIFS